MVQVQVFLQGGSWHFSYLIFQSSSFLHLEVLFLKIVFAEYIFAFCKIMHLKKNYFFLPL